MEWGRGVGGVRTGGMGGPCATAEAEINGTRRAQQTRARAGAGIWLAAWSGRHDRARSRAEIQAAGVDPGMLISRHAGSCSSGARGGTLAWGSTTVRVVATLVPAGSLVSTRARARAPAVPAIAVSCRLPQFTCPEYPPRARPGAWAPAPRRRNGRERGDRQPPRPARTGVLPGVQAPRRPGGPMGLVGTHARAPHPPAAPRTPRCRVSSICRYCGDICRDRRARSENVYICRR